MTGKLTKEAFRLYAGLPPRNRKERKTAEKLTEKYRSAHVEGDSDYIAQIEEQARGIRELLEAAKARDSVTTEETTQLDEVPSQLNE